MALVGVGKVALFYAAKVAAARFAMRIASIVFLAQTLGPPAKASDEQSALLDFSGMCEASAAAQVAPGMVVVADDEDNVLRIFAMTGGTPVVADSAILSFLGVPTTSGSDIEGAARVGKRIYWITSHSLTKNAKLKPKRSAFFATDIEATSPTSSLRRAGIAYVGLRDLLIASPELKHWNLEDAATRAPETGLKEADVKNPSLPSSPIEATLRAEGGLNIEGLADRSGGALLIGLRSPVRGGMALVFTLANPAKVLKGKRPILREPIEVDLRGLGIRSMDRIGLSDDYLVVAGPVAGGAPFQLFKWHRGDSTARRLEPPPPTFSPEAAVLPMEEPGEVLLMSDDGDYPNKDDCGGTPPRHFRGILQPLREAPQ